MGKGDINKIERLKGNNRNNTKYYEEMLESKEYDFGQRVIHEENEWILP